MGDRGADDQGGAAPRAGPALPPHPKQAGWGGRALGRPLPDEAVLDPDGGFWVFAYGSLMWNPGFDYAERREALLPGFRRSFCLWSVRYRGTPERPGLVVALDREAAAATRGVAYRVAPERARETRVYLTERELVSAAYHEAVAETVLLSAPGEAARGEAGRQEAAQAEAANERRRAVTYVIDRSHEQYAGHLSLSEQAAVIACSVGPMGRNCEYLFNTVGHLRELGLSDAEIGDLAALEAQVRRLQAAE